MNKLLYLFLLISTLASGQENIEVLLDSLDAAILKRDYYNSKREQRITSLKKLFSEAGDKESSFHIVRSLADEYMPYNIDSAFYYSSMNIEQAREISDIHMLIDAKLMLSRIYSLSGMYRESEELLDSIIVLPLTNAEKTGYYGARIALNEYRDNGQYKTLNSTNYKYIRSIYQDSLLAVLDKSDPGYYVTEAILYSDKGEFDKAVSLIKKSLDIQTIEDRSYGFSAHTLATVYGYQGDNYNQKKYLALSAISDIIGGVRENISLRELALLLYESGDLKRAHNYIKIALEDAQLSNTQLRSVEVLQILPLIEQEYIDTRERMNSYMVYFGVVLSVLVLILLITLVFLSMQKRKLHVAVDENIRINSELASVNRQLKESNDEVISANSKLESLTDIQEEYIAHYLKLSSEYIGKIDDYRKSLHRVATNEKRETIIKALRSEDFIESELKVFYNDFDRSFLDLYPNFVSDINKLLDEDEQIELKSSELLNTEIRIFALIRLGITESAQIAKFLRYSVSTIYNYRTTMRNRSKGPRDLFEDEVMKIGSYTNYDSK
ncbi:MAG: DUF6377 domain-containing protein [Bacteroidota bacterium]